MIYTLGYAGIRLDDVHRWLAENNAVLGDTRFKPWSREETWRKYHLQRVLGPRYVHLTGFGNKRYQETDRDAIDLVDPAAAIRQVKDLLDQGLRVVLLCGCWKWSDCHRREAARQTIEALGLDGVIHLTKADLSGPAAGPPPTPQMLLF